MAKSVLEQQQTYWRIEMDIIKLKVFIAGSAQQAAPALANLRQFCATEIPGRYEIEVIDILERPQLAGQEGVIATPTLLKLSPAPVRRIVGDFSDREALRSALDLTPDGSDG